MPARQYHAEESQDPEGPTLAGTLGVSGELARLAFGCAGPGALAHGVGVAVGAARVGREYGMSSRAVRRLKLAGLVHDVGKSELPAEILQKPGALNSREWEWIRRHPEIGADMLAARGLQDVAHWVLAHHERPDGLGYPSGLRAWQIPLEARILAVADSFDAMTSVRSYSAAMSRAEAAAELQRVSGTQLDATVVAAFLAVVAPDDRSGSPPAALALAR